MMLDTTLVEQAKTYKITRAFKMTIDIMEVEYQSFRAVLGAKS